MTMLLQHWCHHYHAVTKIIFSLFSNVYNRHFVGYLSVFSFVLVNFRPGFHENENMLFSKHSVLTETSDGFASLMYRTRSGQN